LLNVLLMVVPRLVTIVMMHATRIRASMDRILNRRSGHLQKPGRKR